MSVSSISGVTLWIGQSNEKGPSVAQMTRKISHFAIHNGYNSLNYVNCHNIRKLRQMSLFFKHFVCFFSSIRPTTLPSSKWTSPSHFQGVLDRFVCQRPVTTPTNTPTLWLQLWDGDQIVISERSLCYKL